MKLIKQIAIRVVIIIVVSMLITWLIELAVIGKQEQRIHWLERDLETCNEYNRILTEAIQSR